MPRAIRGPWTVKKQKPSSKLSCSSAIKVWLRREEGLNVTAKGQAMMEFLEAALEQKKAAVKYDLKKVVASAFASYVSSAAVELKTVRTTAWPVPGPSSWASRQAIFRMSRVRSVNRNGNPMIFISKLFHDHFDDISPMKSSNSAVFNIHQ